MLQYKLKLIVWQLVHIYFPRKDYEFVWLMNANSYQRSIFVTFGCQSNQIFLSSYSIDLLAKNNLFSATEPETAGQKDLHADRDLKTVAHHLHENLLLGTKLSFISSRKNFIPIRCKWINRSGFMNLLPNIICCNSE